MWTRRSYDIQGSPITHGSPVLRLPVYLRKHDYLPETTSVKQLAQLGLEFGSSAIPLAMEAEENATALRVPTGPSRPCNSWRESPKNSSRCNESIHGAIDNIQNQQVKLPKMQKSFQPIATVLQDLYWSIGGMRSELIDGDAGLEAVRAAQR